MAIWHRLPGLAKDVAVDSAGIAWIIGTNPLPGGFGIYKWNATFQDWTSVDGAAVRIACGRVLPIVVNDVDDIYRRDVSSPIWRRLPGRAKDVSAMEDFEGNFDHIGAIGTNPLMGGFGTYWWDSSRGDWTATPGAGVAISGAFHVINDRDEIHEGTIGVSPGWTRMPGAGRDIGANLNSVWLIGTNPIPGGFGIYKWNSTIHDWDSVEGAGVRIGCGRDGVPWVVNDRDEIYRRVE